MYVRVILLITICYNTNMCFLFCNEISSYRVIHIYAHKNYIHRIDYIYNNIQLIRILTYLP